MAYFAGYGFNKSHSAAYAMIAYQTAYLKANYPAEFMACLISLEATHAEKMAFYLAEAKELGLVILPPDINQSQIDFSVVNNQILFGLHGIKNVGLAALENIIAERTKKSFLDLLDFCQRVDLRTANKRVIENLICAGAFDKLAGNRAQKMAELESVMEIAAEHKKSLLTGQMGLFKTKTHTTGGQVTHVFAPLPDWDSKLKLAKESEVIGFYISAHPLDSYQSHINWLNLDSFTKLVEKYGATASSQLEPLVNVIGLKKGLRIINTKNGDQMAFLQLEDRSGNADIIVFPRQYKKLSSVLEQSEIFIVQGLFDLTSTVKCKIKANQIVPAEQFFEMWPEFKKATLILEQTPDPKLIQLIGQQKGKINVQIKFQEQNKTLLIQTKYKVSADLDLFKKLESLCKRIQLSI